MPLPKPNKGEKRQKFIGRCMGNSIMVKEFPEQKQRAAVCNNQWKESEDNIWKKIRQDVFALKLQTALGKSGYRKNTVPKKPAITVINVRGKTEAMKFDKRIKARVRFGQTINEAFQSLGQLLRDAVETQVPGKTYVVDFSTKQVVYEVGDENGKYSYYKVDYKIVKGEAKLGSAPEPVLRKTTWEALELDEQMSFEEFTDLVLVDKDVKELMEQK